MLSNNEILKLVHLKDRYFSKKKYAAEGGTFNVPLSSRTHFSVSFAATKSQSPTVYDHENVLLIVKYLYTTQEKGLL